MSNIFVVVVIGTLFANIIFMIAFQQLATWKIRRMLRRNREGAEAPCTDPDCGCKHVGVGDLTKGDVTDYNGIGDLPMAPTACVCCCGRQTLMPWNLRPGSEPYHEELRRNGWREVPVTEGVKKPVSTWVCGECALPDQGAA